MKLYHKVKDELLSAWRQAEHPLLLHYTGSMFGIGCDARDISALERINQLKRRPPGTGYIVLLDSVIALDKYSVMLPAAMKGLLEQYSPGSLTVVLPCAAPELAHLQVAGKVAFRIPDEEDLLQLLFELKLPLISTSINMAGETPEIDFRNIMTTYNSWFDLALVPDDELIAEGEPSTVITLQDDKLVCLREGKLPFAQLEEDYYEPEVNFMCTGNICRSPLAEYYFRQQAERKGLKWRVISSGVLDTGVAISENSLLLLQREGIDASAHHSLRISQEIIKRNRLVLTMTRQHRNTLINAGWDKGNVFTLGEFVGHNEDISDPYRQSLEVYEQAYTQIKFYVDLLIDKLLEKYK
ncbi:MAG: Sua5/YciO/YrdC/YwlC family protein [Candidatus Cloacimonetes bacterium]|nr:Sua5/YciO/YrdC/YwlC family protein [Candidatus Cloacimonadota bacterium]